jgi:hypothetical protein
METMQILLKSIFMMIFAFFKNQSALAIENLALRQQLHIYHHSRKRPKIRLRDRLFWILISRLWNKWENTFIKNRLLSMFLFYCGISSKSVKNFERFNFSDAQVAFLYFFLKKTV